MNRPSVEDLKPPGNCGVITPYRAFTLSELICYRYRDAGVSDEQRKAAEEIARLIVEVARAWENK